MRLHMPDQRGYTLVEVIIGTVILCVTALVLVPYFQRPAKVAQAVSKDDALLKALHAMDIVVNDIKEAYPSTIDWKQIAPSGTANLAAISFKKANYTPGAADPTSYNHIDLQYDDAAQQLVRTDTPEPLAAGDSPQVATLLTGMDPPTADDPLIRKDPQGDAYHVLIVTMLYHLPGLPQQRLIRRVAVKG